MALQKRRLPKFLILLLALGISQKALSAFKVVILGSSTAAGTGASSIATSWVGKYTSYLKTLNPDNTVVNLAVGGYNTSSCMPTGSGVGEDAQHNITAALTYNPDVIIVSLPSNDAASNMPIEQTEFNFTTIYNTSIKAGVPIYFTTTAPRNLSTAQIDVLIKTRDWITSTFKDRSINFWTTLANPDGTINPSYGYGDGIHFNDSGHEILYEKVKEKNILQNLALNYYSKPAGDLSNVNSWGINPDGTGITPVSFLKITYIFTLTNRPGITILTTPWVVNGQLVISAGHTLNVSAIIMRK